ncbi:uncharacterized protein K02A2.6-like [Pecten maximus]|uniref:uncharacterized protein K02A2.6-like n=1 Tax=Pecten maximus TaxID=6579 RepID=UPI001458604A|nr:uncharacterized protein K02A2.6-like [Pecten maximus]
MASYHVQPPENFTFSKPEEWTSWFKRFERFRIASELLTKDEVVQVNTLIYSMGGEAENIVKSFGMSAADMKKYTVVSARFNGYFITRRNTIFERAKFNHRKQNEGEAADSFITALYGLVEHCEYGQLRDEMIRDRIVVGIRDSKLSEKLQLDATLTLEKAVAQVRQSEAVKKQQTVVRDSVVTTTTPSSSVDALSKNSKKGYKHHGSKRQYDKSHTSKFQGQANQECQRCGFKHRKDKCPAFNATCRKCSKKGHFEKKCRTTLSEIEQYKDDGYQFLGSIDDSSKPWTVSLCMDGLPVEFKIDTGADVTAIPEVTFNKLKGLELEKTSKLLQGPGKNRLRVLGKFMSTLTTEKGVQATTEVYVIKTLNRALLGRPAIEKLNLVKTVADIHQQSVQIEEKKKQFPKLFSGLGKFHGEYKIELREDAKPYAITTARRVALPLLDKVKDELQRMEQQGVISPVVEPTDWCSGLVVVPKKDGRVRICVDLTQLNKSVRREHHQLPSVEQTLHSLTGAKVFSKIDAKAGFWQIPLEQTSRLLTTFITPFGRYCFNRLPFGISSAPEHFQRRMSQLLDSELGVVCQMDDVLIFGTNQEEHDQRLESVLKKLETAGVTLNEEKCEFSKPQVTFVGHIIDSTGIRPDPKKVQAILKFEAPSNVSEVRRFMGIVNQLGRFSPNIAEKSKPIRDLLQKDTTWLWGPPQSSAFQQIKQELSSTPVLSLYDPAAPTKVSADASSYGLGGVLLQKPRDNSDQDWKPVAYASRAMNATEQRYAQVEKEALAATWACEKFSDLLVGMHFQIETDHKPLVSLLGSKPLSELPPRVQRFRMRLMRYDYDINHVPGKLLYIADALSRAPLRQSEPPEEESFHQEVEAYVDSILMNVPASEARLEEIRLKLREDSVCGIILSYCQDGWPGYEKPSISVATRPYWQVKDELSVCQGLLLRGNRLVIPTSLRAEIMQKLHDGHQGIVKCRERAKDSVWWPGMNREIADVVKNCTTCIRKRADIPEPLKPSEFPERPWQKLGTDLFHWKGSNYLLVVDYFSRYIELAKLSSTTSPDIVLHLQSMFARHGIPETLVSDNGPQYASAVFQQFADKYGFIHRTSSPHHPQGNGETERAVQTVKRLFGGSKDSYLALLAYRATPLRCGHSPAELLMGRKIRTTLPENPNNLEPKWPDLTDFRAKEREHRVLQKQNFDRSQRAKERPPLRSGDMVWVSGPGGGYSGTIREPVSDRSFLVNGPSGTVRRNRRHLMLEPENLEPDEPEGMHNFPNEQTVLKSFAKNCSSQMVVGTPGKPVSVSVSSPNVSKTVEPSVVRTRSGRVSKVPQKMDM